MPGSRRDVLTATMVCLASSAVSGGRAGSPRPPTAAAGVGGSAADSPVAAGAAAPALASPPFAGRVRVGAYLHLLGHPFRDPVAPADLHAIEAAVGRRFGLVHYFFTWGRAFQEAVTSNVDGRTPVLSMKPDGSLVQEIASGAQDAYIDRFASEARDFGRTVYLRFGHEMNGQWMSYSAGNPQGPPAPLFVAAWRHLVGRFRARGADNVRFVWCPNESDVPNRAGNHLEDYWPGRSHVDVAAFDAYNWSAQHPVRGDGVWRSFEEIVEGPYTRLKALTTLPIWLGEFGTVEAVAGVDPPGADKGEWFRAMFASTRFRRLETVLYFSEDDQRDTQRDWRLDSSPASLRGFREGWAGGRNSTGGDLS